MLRYTVAASALALVALAGCSKALDPEAALSPSSTASKSTVTTPAVEATTVEPTPEPTA